MFVILGAYDKYIKTFKILWEYFEHLKVVSWEESIL